MNGHVQIAVLSDNAVLTRDTCAEHGLAFFIEAGATRFLFDLGQGMVLVGNARAMGIDLRAADRIVLSHGHYDHAGGLAAASPLLRDGVTLHAHPQAMEPKYKRGDNGVRSIGLPPACRDALPRVRLALSREPVELAPGIRTSGEVPRVHPEETIDEPFCLDPEGRKPDPMLDDQALLIRTPAGTVVVLGCAHAGVVNTLDRVRALTDGAPIRAVLGGMHLGNASERRIGWTIDRLRRFKPGLLAPMHCTGQKAMAALWTAFPDVCAGAGTGARYVFEKER